MYGATDDDDGGQWSVLRPVLVVDEVEEQGQRVLEDSLLSHCTLKLTARRHTMIWTCSAKLSRLPT
jgi:hypothetical protein